MELFTPDIGLIIWMFIPFLIVFLILAKFAWPVIMKGVEERSKFIDDSIQSAKEANDRLAGIQAEGERIIAEAREEQLRLLNEASEIKNKMINEAKVQAGVEAGKIMEDAKIAIQKEKEKTILDIRQQVIEISFDIAEKVVRKNLENKPAQMEIIDKLFDEVSISQS